MRSLGPNFLQSRFSQNRFVQKLLALSIDFLLACLLACLFFRLFFVGSATDAVELAPATASSGGVGQPTSFSPFFWDPLFVFFFFFHVFLLFQLFETMPKEILS